MVAEGGDGLRLEEGCGPADQNEVDSRWESIYETVAQYVQVMQKIAFTAAGVVVHQHTRVLMADLHGQGDGMPVDGCRSSRQRWLQHTRP